MADKTLHLHLHSDGVFWDGGSGWTAFQTLSPLFNKAGLVVYSSTCVCFRRFTCGDLIFFGGFSRRG